MHIGYRNMRYRHKKTHRVRAILHGGWFGRTLRIGESCGSLLCVEVKPLKPQRILWGCMKVLIILYQPLFQGHPHISN